MTETESKDISQLLSTLSSEDYCYLTTTGRKSGNPHEIEIWFGARDSALYLLSGGGDASDWVKNIRANPSVTVRIGKYTFEGTARIGGDKKEDSQVRRTLAQKYQEWEEGDLSDWAKHALLVAIHLKSIK